jgi:hypothetical protein
MAGFQTPRSAAGQIVEESYGWIDGELYCRVEDRSDQTVKYYRADKRSRDRLAGSSYDAGGANYPPRVRTWTPCADPTIDDEAGAP